MKIELPPRCTPRSEVEKLTAEGIEQTRLEPSLFREIADFHHYQSQPVSEFIPGDFVKAASGQPASRLHELPILLRLRLHRVLKPQLEAWVQRPLKPTYVYGVRTYLNGATLAMHRDRDHTHVVSAILNVGQNVDKPWALQVEGEADGPAWRECFMMPGDVLFYESMRLNHGRIVPLEGASYSNAFIHFALA